MVKIEKLTDWSLVKRCACDTVGKVAVEEPNDTWKCKILAAEHSPIRTLMFYVKITDVPYFAAMHLVRHKHGVEWFVSTSRQDRTGVKRSDRKQTDTVTLSFVANAQALINISHKRLCHNADPATRKVWNEVCKALYEVDYNVAAFCVPECIYKNDCREFNSCGLWTKLAKK